MKLSKKLNDYSKSYEKLSIEVKDAIHELYETYDKNKDFCEWHEDMNYSKFKNFLDDLH